MIAELTQRLTNVEDVLSGIVQGQRSLNESQRVIAEQQVRLIELLTPKEKPKGDGPRLDELLAAMIVRMDVQNHLLKDVSNMVSKAVTALPLSVVQAIADAFSSSDWPTRTPPRNGHEGGTA